MNCSGFITAADFTDDDYFYFTVRVDKDLFPKHQVIMGELVGVRTLATPVKDNE